MELVGAGTHDHDELSARVEAVFCGVAAREHLHFFHRFGRRRERNRVDARLGSNHAVEGGVLVGFALAVSYDRDGLAGDRDAAAAASLSVEAATAAEHHACLQSGEVTDVTAVDREFDEAALFDCSAERSFVCLKLGCLGRDFHAFGDLTDVELEVHADLFVDLNLDPAAGGRLESRHGDVDLVLADINERKSIVARRTRDGLE